MVDRESLATPFFVTAYKHLSSHEEAEIDEGFSDYETAREKYSAVRSNPDLLVYFAEIGAFADSRGTLKIDFVTFDTNDLEWWKECSSINRPGRRGFGRPSNHEGYSTDYKPIAELHWRL